MALKKKRTLKPHELYHRATTSLHQAQQDLDAAFTGFEKEREQYQATADLYLQRAALSAKQADDTDDLLDALRRAITSA